MLDIDPGLDTKLRAFFEQVEASAPPSGLTDIKVVMPDRRRRTLNLIAGVAAAALVAASVTVLALELRSHDKASPTPAGTSAPSPASSRSPFTSQLKEMPLLGGAGVPASAHVVIPLTRGHGSVQLQTFVPQGTLYLQFDCAGPGPFKLISTNHVVGQSLLQCSSSIGATTMTVGSPKLYDDKPLTLQVTADGSMVWEVYISESRPPLPVLTVLPDQRVLVSVTYGTGSITLPTFSVGPDEWLDVRDACNSGSSADTLEIVGNMFTFGDDKQFQCSNPTGSGVGGFGSGPPGSGGSGPISLQVKAEPSISWEIVIIEGPTALLLESSGDVQVAPVAYGMGSAALPAFTSSQTWSIAVVCSGVGTLTIGSSRFTHTATPGCVDGATYFTPPDQVPGQPVSLSVDAPSGMGWEIFIYRVGAPSSPGACPTVRPAGSPTPEPCVLTGVSESPRTAAARYASRA
jgi:hypothetical protein